MRVRADGVWGAGGRGGAGSSACSDGDWFDFSKYFDSALDYSQSKIKAILTQADPVSRAAARQMLLDRVAQAKHILGDEFTETIERNFVKVVEHFILVKRPDGTVDEFFEGFFKALEGNPSLMKHADDPHVITGGPADPLSEGAKARLKQLLRDPIPGEPHPEIGNPWRLDEVEDWSVPRPVPGNFWARGNLIELWKFKKNYKTAGFKHDSNAHGYDYSSAADDLFVQMKSYSHPDGAAAREAIDKLLAADTPTGSRLQLHIVHKKGTSSTSLSQAIETYLKSVKFTDAQRARFLPTIFEEFVYP